MEIVKALVMTAEDDDTSVPVLPSRFFFSLMFLVPVTDQWLGQRPLRRLVQQVQECFVLLLLHSKGHIEDASKASIPHWSECTLCLISAFS